MRFRKYFNKKVHIIYSAIVPALTHFPIRAKILFTRSNFFELNLIDSIFVACQLPRLASSCGEHLWNKPGKTSE